MELRGNVKVPTCWRIGSGSLLIWRPAGRQCCLHHEMPDSIQHSSPRRAFVRRNLSASGRSTWISKKNITGHLYFVRRNTHLKFERSHNEGNSVRSFGRSRALIGASKHIIKKILVNAAGPVLDVPASRLREVKD